MPRHVALLRGINVGGHRVKMDRLRQLFVELGMRDVSTFIASGNVIFEADGGDTEALEARIEEHLERDLGYAVPTFLRSPEELVTVCAYEPDGHEPDRGLYVLFLKAPADEALRTGLGALDSPTDRFTFEGREVYWSVQGNLSSSPLFAGSFDRAVAGVPSTMRNTTSLRRLVGKLT